MVLSNLLDFNDFKSENSLQSSAYINVNISNYMKKKKNGYAP